MIEGIPGALALTFLLPFLFFTIVLLARAANRTGQGAAVATVVCVLQMIAPILALLDAADFSKDSSLPVTLAGMSGILWLLACVWFGGRAFGRLGGSTVEHRVSTEPLVGDPDEPPPEEGLEPEEPPS